MGTDSLYYIMDYSGNYYRLNQADDMKMIVANESFTEHMKDILEYRTMEYYRRRYEETSL